MKKILTTMIGLAAAVGMVHAQGYLNLSSGTVFGVTTNTALSLAAYNLSPGSYTTGKTSSSTVALNTYDYALLYIASGSAATSTDSNNLANADWVQLAIDSAGSAGAALLLTNDNAAAGNFEGDAIGAGQTSLGIGSQAFANGTTYAIALVGWSTTLGNSWSTVEGELSSADWNPAGGFFGYQISTVNPAGAPTGVTMTAMFGNGHLVLYEVPVPEPATIALAGLGGLSMLLFRRRNKA